MSIRTVLVHLDDSSACSARVECAARLALDVGARLVGMYLVPTHELTPSIAAVLPPDIVAARLHETGELQDAAQRMFLDVVASFRLPASEWMAPAGDPMAAALTYGRCADLLVLGQDDPGDSRQPIAGELIVECLLGLGRPILVVPYIGPARSVGRRILVASDGGREAARATGDAMELLTKAAEVRVLLGVRDGDGRAAYAGTSERLDAWLRDHAVKARIERYDPPAGDSGELLLSRAADFGSDLIVMGGYAHARLRQAVLGGMTSTMLASMTVPVLMSH